MKVRTKTGSNVHQVRVVGTGYVITICGKTVSGFKETEEDVTCHTCNGG